MYLADVMCVNRTKHISVTVSVVMFVNRIMCILVLLGVSKGSLPVLLCVPIGLCIRVLFGVLIGPNITQCSYVCHLGHVYPSIVRCVNTIMFILVLLCVNTVMCIRALLSMSVWGCVSQYC